MLGIPAEVFTSTCHVAQSNLSGIDSKEVGSSIENLLFSADERFNAEHAADILERARRSLLYKNERGGEIFDLRAEYTALHNRLSVATAKARSIVEKEALACEYAQKAEKIKKSLEELEAAWENSEVVHILGNSIHCDGLRTGSPGWSRPAGAWVRLVPDGFARTGNTRPNSAPLSRACDRRGLTHARRGRTAQTRTRPL